MSLIRKHVAVLQAWACLALVFICRGYVLCLYGYSLEARKSLTFICCALLPKYKQLYWYSRQNVVSDTIQGYRRTKQLTT